jgi:hypothetical protein
MSNTGGECYGRRVKPGRDRVVFQRVYESIPRIADWKAVISRHNGQEGSFLPRRRRTFAGLVITVAANSQIAEGVSQNQQG